MVYPRLLSAFCCLEKVPDLILPVGLAFSHFPSSSSSQQQPTHRVRWGVREGATDKGGGKRRSRWWGYPKVESQVSGVGYVGVSDFAPNRNMPGHPNCHCLSSLAMFAFLANIHANNTANLLKPNASEWMDQVCKLSLRAAEDLFGISIRSCRKQCKKLVYTILRTYSEPAYISSSPASQTLRCLSCLRPLILGLC